MVSEPDLEQRIIVGEGDAKRLEWVDAFKGVGILMVLCGHIVEGPIKSAIYLFHMPMFFLLSGYLFVPKGPWKQIVRGTRGLLVPTISGTLTVLTLFWLLPNVFNLDSGMVALRNFAAQGNFVVLWFIPVLLLTLFAAELLERLPIAATKITFPCLILLSYINEGFSFADGPLSVASSLLALPIFLVGRWFRKVERKPSMPIFVLAASALLCSGSYPGLSFDMAAGEYGVFPLSLIFACVITWALVHIVKIALREVPLRSIRSLGGASLFVMILHQPLQIFLYRFTTFDNEILRLSVTVLLCVLTAQVILRNSMLAKIYLGSVLSRPC